MDGDGGDLVPGDGKVLGHLKSWTVKNFNRRRLSLDDVTRMENLQKLQLVNLVCRVKMPSLAGSVVEWSVVSCCVV